MKNPIKAPRNAPIVPFHVAPNLRAPHAPKTKSAICPISISRPAMITIFQVTESSGPIHRRWVITPTQTINVPGTIGSREPKSPSMKITEQRPSAVYSIGVILIPKSELYKSIVPYIADLFPHSAAIEFAFAISGEPRRFAVCYDRPDRHTRQLARSLCRAPTKARKSLQRGA